MRDLILAPIIVWLCFSAIRHPWIGIMGWTWISLMNPHALTWQLNYFAGGCSDRGKHPYRHIAYQGQTRFLGNT